MSEKKADVSVEQQTPPTLAEKKLAQLAYAENYRAKVREDKESRHSAEYLARERRLTAERKQAAEARREETARKLEAERREFLAHSQKTAAVLAQLDGTPVTDTPAQTAEETAPIQTESPEKAKTPAPSLDTAKKSVMDVFSIPRYQATATPVNTEIVIGAPTPECADTQPENPSEDKSDLFFSDFRPVLETVPAVAETSAANRPTEQTENAEDKLVLLNGVVASLEKLGLSTDAVKAEAATAGILSSSPVQEKKKDEPTFDEKVRDAALFLSEYEVAEARAKRLAAVDFAKKFNENYERKKKIAEDAEKAKTPRTLSDSIDVKEDETASQAAAFLAAYAARDRLNASFEALVKRDEKLDKEGKRTPADATEEEQEALVRNYVRDLKDEAMLAKLAERDEWAEILRQIGEDDKTEALNKWMAAREKENGKDEEYRTLLTLLALEKADEAKRQALLSSSVKPDGDADFSETMERAKALSERPLPSTRFVKKSEETAAGLYLSEYESKDEDYKHKLGEIASGELTKDLARGIEREDRAIARRFRQEYEETEFPTDREMLAGAKSYLLYDEAQNLINRDAKRAAREYPVADNETAEEKYERVTAEDEIEISYLKSLRKKLFAKTKKEKGNEKIRATAELLSVDGQIAEKYFEWMTFCLRNLCRKDAVRLKKPAVLAVKKYNETAKSLSDIGGGFYKRASLSIPNDILNGRTYEPLYAPGYRYKEENAEKSATSAVFAKDRAVVESRYNFAIQKIRLSEESHRFSFSVNKDKERYEKRYDRARIRKNKARRARALRAEISDEMRYGKILNVNPLTMPLVKRRANRDKLQSLREELGRAVAVRNEINEKLLAAYSLFDGNANKAVTLRDDGKVQVGRRVIAGADAAYRNVFDKAKRREFRKTCHSATRVKKLFVPEKTKNTLLELLNREVELSAKVKTTAKKIRIYRWHGEAKRAAYKEARKCARELKNVRAEFSGRLKQAKRTDETRPGIRLFR